MFGAMSAGCGLNWGNIMQDRWWYLMMQDLFDTEARIIPEDHMRRYVCWRKEIYLASSGRPRVNRGTQRNRQSWKCKGAW